MSMFCFQCQETAQGKGCTVRGVCGKVPPNRSFNGFTALCRKGRCYCESFFTREGRCRFGIGGISTVDIDMKNWITA